MHDLCAIDVDFRRLTAAFDGPAPDRFVTDTDPTRLGVEVRTSMKYTSTVLIEVASPVSFQRIPKAHLYNVSRWALYNIWAASVIAQDLRDYATVLVSPSNVWTMKYTEAQRHALAQVLTVQGPNRRVTHDAREAFAMLWSYKMAPSLWVPADTYFNNL